MATQTARPRVFRIFDREALEVTATPYGDVGRLHSGGGVEAVWVAKENEAIDPGWFSQSAVDLILVLQGRLYVEFEDPAHGEMTLEPGHLLVLPADTRCRAYRYPRDAAGATLFLAVYPDSVGQEAHG